MPSGTRTYGPNGEILIYTLNQQAGYMTIWNSQQLSTHTGEQPKTAPYFGSWQPQGKTINATGQCPVTSATPYGYNGYTKNITIPKGLLGSAQLRLPRRRNSRISKTRNHWNVYGRHSQRCTLRTMGNRRRNRLIKIQQNDCSTLRKRNSLSCSRKPRRQSYRHMEQRTSSNSGLTASTQAT